MSPRRPWPAGASRKPMERRSVQALTPVDGLPQRLRLVRGHLDHEPPAALERHTQHDAAALLGHLERAVTSPRLHSRHGCTPSVRRGVLLGTRVHACMFFIPNAPVLPTIIALTRLQVKS